MDILGNRFPRASEAYLQELLRQYREAIWRRRQQLRALRTQEDWLAYCRGVRERFRAALGPLPERTPLNPRVTGVLERDGYVVEKLLIESQPGFCVTANLYRPPVVTAPLPAVLGPIGHWADGKAEVRVQARGIGLARQGYVALVYDSIGQGERSQFWDHGGDSPRLRNCALEHTAASLPCFLIGQTVINHMVWDGVRLLDYLVERDDVDARRIGCTGASGGGTHTMFLAALDDRITAAVPVCSTSSYERMLAQGQIGNPCQDPVRSYVDNLDMADLLMAAVPRPLQIIVAQYDVFPLAGAREVYLDVADCYRACGVRERASFVEVPARHDYNQPMRESMYAWFNRWLKDGPAGGTVAEQPFQPEPVSTLWCTTTGQVATGAGDTVATVATVPTINRRRAQALMPARPALDTRADTERHGATMRAAVPQVLNYAHTPAFGAAEVWPGPSVEGLATEHVVFQSEADLPIPGLLIRPPDGAAGAQPGVLFLDERGKATEAGASGLASALARAGAAVFAVDLRGWGETEWRHVRHQGSPYLSLLGGDARLALAGYMLGTWALTQRVLDAVRALDVLAQTAGVERRRMGVVGHGIAGLVALHAAAVDDRIAGVAMYDTLASYQSIVEANWFTEPPSSFIPGVLLSYDLPDLIGALAPAQVLVANPLDAVGQPLSAADADRTFALPHRMFAALGARDRLTVRGPESREVLAAEFHRWLRGWQGQ
jgi:cephalosporin-C deacetylase-like acetyl esterase